MTHYYYYKRLKKALEHRKITTIEQLIDCVRQRARSDRETDGAFSLIIDILEPPRCQVSHCENHTSYRFCNCCLELVPANCPKHREYLKNLYERMDNVYQAGREGCRNKIKEVPEKFRSGYLGSKQKEKIFTQGVRDERDGLPNRSMKTWKIEGVK